LAEPPNPNQYLPAQRTRVYLAGQPNPVYASANPNPYPDKYAGYNRSPHTIVYGVREKFYWEAQLLPIPAPDPYHTPDNHLRGLVSYACQAEVKVVRQNTSNILARERSKETLWFAVEDPGGQANLKGDPIWGHARIDRSKMSNEFWRDYAIAMNQTVDETIETLLDETIKVAHQRIAELFRTFDGLQIADYLHNHAYDKPTIKPEKPY
jgi:hypothetical protein